jgi:hypothetical protein
VPWLRDCEFGKEESMKKLQVRKTGPVKLTSVYRPMYGGHCAFNT